VTLAFVLPHMFSTLFGYDRVHVASPELRRHGLIANALEPMRFADLTGLTLVLAPLALPALLVRGLRGSRAERWMMLALALPLAEAMFWVHPVQGAFRDWDVFAPAAAALALASASRVGRQLGAAGARRWVGVAVIAVTFLPTIQWLAHFTSVAQGFRRIEAFASEPPRRSDTERGLAWDFIGIRSYRLRDLDGAVRAWERAADITPARRIFEQWARGEMGAAICARRRASITACWRATPPTPRAGSSWPSWISAFPIPATWRASRRGSSSCGRRARTRARSAATWPVPRRRAIRRGVERVNRKRPHGEGAQAVSPPARGAGASRRETSAPNEASGAARRALSATNDTSASRGYSGWRWACSPSCGSRTRSSRTCGLGIKPSALSRPRAGVAAMADRHARADSRALALRAEAARARR